MKKNLLYFENYTNCNCEHKIVVIDHKQEFKRLDLVISSLYPDISRSRVKNWIFLGAVTLDGFNSKPSAHVKSGQTVEIYPPVDEDNNDWISEKILLNIVHEDSSIIVINKQSGLVVHPGAGNPNGTLLNGLIYHCPLLKKLPRAGIVHRLDKDTSGLLVIAKTLEAHKSLVDQLQRRTVKRLYVAVSWGKLISRKKKKKSLARNRFNRQKFSVSDASYAKESHTKITPIGYGKIGNNNVSVIECCLTTGRTHQIRVHLEYVNFPIIGDNTYKKGVPLNKLITINRQALHAKSLSFIHPSTKKKVEFTINMPEDILDLLKQINSI